MVTSGLVRQRERYFFFGIATPKPDHPGLARADGAVPFAEAAALALRDRMLWMDLSRRALRHQRMLTPARQGAVLARHLASGDISARLPSERACVVVCDSCESAARRRALRVVMGALLRLRVSVHVLLLPASLPNASEANVMGWTQAQGVFFYPGSPEEQWSALLASAPYPPPSFAVALPHALADVSRQLYSPACAAAQPTASLCFWAAPHLPPPPLQSILPLLAQHSVRALASANGDDDSGGGGQLNGASATQDGGGSLVGLHMLQMIECIRSDGGLPVAVWLRTLHAPRLRRALDAVHDHAAAESVRASDSAAVLVQLLARYERELLSRSTVVLVRQEAHGGDLRDAASELERTVIELPRPGLELRAADAAWTDVVVAVLQS